MGYIRIMAGDTSLAVIRDGGFNFSKVKIVVGAAGGPKWLILYHFDRFLASLIEKGKIGKGKLFLAGSSVGSWRFSALCFKNPLEAINSFLEAYMGQRYSLRPTPKEITREAIRILDCLMPESRREEIFENPFCRLSIFTVRNKKGIVNLEGGISLFGWMVFFGLLNRIKRESLGLFIKRCIFHDYRDCPPFRFQQDKIATEFLPLKPENIREVLLASGSIPTVMKAIKNIPSAPPGVYRDGGIIDYHLDIPYHLDGFDEFVLFPHYSSRIIPGWFDKTIKRKPCCENLKQVVLVAPSNDFMKKLPYGRIPDRKDFYDFKGRDKDRISYWQKAIEAGKMMVEEFVEAVESGKISKLVEPIDCEG